MGQGYRSDSDDLKHRTTPKRLSVISHLVQSGSKVMAVCLMNDNIGSEVLSQALARLVFVSMVAIRDGKGFAGKQA
jgi:hypothetical protein